MSTYQARDGRFVVDMNTTWDLEDKRTNELAQKNAIETTEKHTLYIAHSKTTGEFWDHLFEPRRIKRAYRGAQ